MPIDYLWVILARWLHISTACVLVGSIFFVHVLFPRTPEVDNDVAEATELRVWRRMKMMLHAALLLLLLSGAYNAWRNWRIYTTNPGVMHGLFGTHLLLGLFAIVLLMVSLSGRLPKSVPAPRARLALLCLFAGIAVASTLKSARERAMTSAPASMRGPSR